MFSHAGPRQSGVDARSTMNMREEGQAQQPVDQPGLEALHAVASTGSRAETRQPPPSVGAVARSPP